MDAPAATPTARDPAEPDASKLRLILVAERLFGQRGIDGVSLRAIAAAAGQGNNNAVQYHFGSKQGLVLALTAYRVAQMDPPRRRMLEAARAAGRSEDLRVLFEILCLPQLELVDEDGLHPYARFMSQFVPHCRARGLVHAGELPTAGSSSLRGLVGLIIRRIDHVPAQVVRGRLELCTLMFSNMLVRCDNERLRSRAPAAFAQVVRDTVQLAATAAAAPHAGGSGAPCSVAAWLELMSASVPVPRRPGLARRRHRMHAADR